MIIVYVLGGLFFGFIALIVVMRVVISTRMRKLQGKAAPELRGRMQQRVSGGRRALFYFHSPGCGACRTMTPVVKRLQKKSKGVFAVDISLDMDTARRFSVMATPTTVLIDGGIIEQVLVGPQPQTTLEGLLSS